MHLLIEIIAFFAFLGSAGVWWHERHRKNRVAVALAGLIASGSTILLGIELAHFLESNAQKTPHIVAPNGINNTTDDLTDQSREAASKIVTKRMENAGCPADTKLRRQLIQGMSNLIAQDSEYSKLVDDLIACESLTSAIEITSSISNILTQDAAYGRIFLKAIDMKDDGVAARAIDATNNLLTQDSLRRKFIEETQRRVKRT